MGARGRWFESSHPDHSMIKPQTFSVSEAEANKVEKWLRKRRHSKSCYITEWTFRPTGVGVVVIVTCNCGMDFNATDYDSW